MSRSDVKTWHEDAVCRRETPEIPVWTSDKSPKRLVQVHIEQMCERCPVKVQCAIQALDDDEEAATWAGVHLPEKSRRDQWHAARAQLQRIRDAG
ncbi:MAG: WhiB family transcriptional regulator, partial [Mycobacterium sp.]